jgi:hypothetical protein
MAQSEQTWEKFFVSATQVAKIVVKWLFTLDIRLASEVVTHDQRTQK